MITRREARERAMQILFRLEVNPDDISRCLRDFQEDDDPPAELIEFTERIVRGAIEHIDEIDGIIQKHTRNWGLKRVGRVERNVMRMAVWELLYCDEIPPIVSINEAIDIAKQYGSEESGKFVNGILDGIRKDLHLRERPAPAVREAAPGEP